MNQLLQSVIGSDSVLYKAFFLMVCGVLSVFAVQVVFYLIAKLWPRGGQDKG